jgi:hypothetical protein
LDMHLSANIRYKLQLIGQFSTSIHPTQYPQCLSAFTFGLCISPSGVSILLQSISLYVWLIHQPMWCICFIVLYQPIQSLSMGPYIFITISYYISPYSPLVWAHTYSLQFLLQSAEIRWLDVIGHLYMSGLTVLSVGYG